MRKKICLQYLFWGVMGLCLFQLTACNDFIEKDLSKKNVTQRFPSKDAIINSQPILFNWDSVSYANKYTFQIVLVSASGGMSLVADSVTKVRRIQKTLSPGKYIWRVSARNDGSSTPFSESAFTVTATVQSKVLDGRQFAVRKETEGK